MTNKRILAVLAVAIAAVPRAEAGYYGARLHAGATYTFRVADAGFGTSSMLLSVTRGRLEVEEVRVTPPGALVDVTFTVPSRASRIILAIDLQCQDAPVLCGQAVVTLVDQNGTVLAPVTLADGDHAQIVLDVLP